MHGHVFVVGELNAVCSIKGSGRGGAGETRGAKRNTDWLQELSESPPSYHA